MEMQALADKFTDIYGVNLDENNGLVILNQCIKKISEEYPKFLKDFVLTVADQLTYTVTKEGLIKISQVYYNRSTLTVNSDSDSTIEYGARTLSSQFTDICEREMFNKMNPVDACITDINIFDLIPTPTESGIKVYYEYEAYRTIDEIPDIFEDLIFRLFFYYERELDFRKTMRANSGNVFQFDRAGNIRAGAGQAGAEDPIKTRANELKGIVKDIRSIVMKLGR